MIRGFNQGGQQAMGKVSIHLVIGDLETTSWFHLIDFKASYNVLLERPWIHNSNVVPSTFHQFLRYCKDGIERKIKVEENRFTIEEAHVADAKFYQSKKTDGLQPKKEPEEPKVAQPSHPNAATDSSKEGGIHKTQRLCDTNARAKD
ncbi:hypothetical protein LIER_30443 [Lithospermum erythrorhizon]|uniref:DUF4283 domain-containing protein n=1 Tax=Lithospermum erythrorhizon TaxID=34254 RepID=A0AAV3RMP7_LITER